VNQIFFEHHVDMDKHGPISLPKTAHAPEFGVCMILNALGCCIKWFSHLYFSVYLLGRFLQ
jgi:hypothetical protein